MTRTLIFVAFLFLLGSCRFFQSAEREVCDKILSREEMTQLLFDLYFTEGFLADRQAHMGVPQDSVALFFDGVFEEHGISYETFQEALNCYLMHPDEMTAIHEALLTRLKIERTQIQAEAYRKAREAARPIGYIWLYHIPPQVEADSATKFSVRRLIPEVFFIPN